VVVVVVVVVVAAAAAAEPKCVHEIDRDCGVLGLCAKN
jgi:hypothetical protein